MQPAFGRLPVAFDGGGREAQDFRRFFDRQAAEVTQFNQSRQWRIKCGEFVERLIEQDDVYVRGGVGDEGDFGEGDFDRACATLFGQVAARVIYQQAAHDFSHCAEKVRAVLPVHLPLIHQLQINLVDQRRRLQRVIGALVFQAARRQPPQFIIDDGHQFIQRRRLAALPGKQELGDVVRSVFCHGV